MRTAKMTAQRPLSHPYFTAYPTEKGWRASTDLGYFHGPTEEDVREQYEYAREEVAKNARR